MQKEKHQKVIYFHSLDVTKKYPEQKERFYKVTILITNSTRYKQIIYRKAYTRKAKESTRERRIKDKMSFTVNP